MTTDHHLEGRSEPACRRLLRRQAETSQPIAPDLAEGFLCVIAAQGHDLFYSECLVAGPAIGHYALSRGGQPEAVRLADGAGEPPLRQRGR
jgi:hypothetical protein